MCASKFHCNKRHPFFTFLAQVDEYKEGSKLDLGILKNLIWNPWNDHVWIRGIDRCPEKEVTQE